MAFTTLSVLWSVVLSAQSRPPARPPSESEILRVQASGHGYLYRQIEKTKNVPWCRPDLPYHTAIPLPRFYIKIPFSHLALRVFLYGDAKIALQNTLYYNLHLVQLSCIFMKRNLRVRERRPISNSHLWVLRSLTSSVFGRVWRTLN